MSELEALSPVDGRYGETARALSGYFSEKASIKYHLVVEGEYLIALSETDGVTLREFTDHEKKLVRGVCEVSLEDAQAVKAIETTAWKGLGPTNHDVKAIEYYFKERLKGTSLEKESEWVHFALTSWDVNNAAYSLMLAEATRDVLVPEIEKLAAELEALALKHKSTAMLARTHGQPASPTTFGKEFRVFSERIKRQLAFVKGFEFTAKLNGATGNYNAHHSAFPRVDWVKFSEDFVEKLGRLRGVRLKANLVTTQVEPYDNCAEFFDALKRLNNVVVDFDQDAWRYVSDDWLAQKAVKGEVGSSTMPHKVNPIDFENSEGNLKLANSLLAFFSEKLPVSRLQRDLSDSTVKRNFGVALAHCLIGYKSALKGLQKVEVNQEKTLKALEESPEVVSEAIQTILKREGVRGAYEKLKDFTRGRKATAKDFEALIDSLSVPDSVKEELKRVTPGNYTGLASRIAEGK